MASTDTNQSKEVDIYRDTFVRYLGYTNEVGEAFRPLIHKTTVRASYAVALLYVMADANDKKDKMKAYLSSQNIPAEAARSKVLTATLDAFLWQTIASIALPGLVINRICAANYYLLKKNTDIVKPVRKYITTGVGLLCIPFIIHPIDNFTTFALDRTVRKWWFSE